MGDEIERDEDLDALNEVIMAVDMRNNGNVGCAYYVAREEVLYLMPDAPLGGKEMVDMREFARS
jgi:DNA mismatch repair protein MSH5